MEALFPAARGDCSAMFWRRRAEARLGLHMIRLHLAVDPPACMHFEKRTHGGRSQQVVEGPLHLLRDGQGCAALRGAMQPDVACPHQGNMRVPLLTRQRPFEADQIRQADGIAQREARSHLRTLNVQPQPAHTDSAVRVPTWYN